jgi:hypothetical protein
MMKAVRLLSIALALGLATTAGKAQQGGFVGAQACAGCHAEQFAAQARSAHAGALAPAAAHPLADRIVAAPPTRDGVWTYDFERPDPESLAISLRSGEQARRLAVDWAFGSGYQAVTFVSQLNEDAYLEHHLSYYTGADRLGLTPGHQALPIGTIDEAQGLAYPTFSPQSEILRCFRCHSTGPLDLTETFAVQPRELGVRCEACHGPGETHIKKIQAGEPAAAKLAIANPGRLDAVALMASCGGCHRPPASDGEAVDWRDPWNVRHQPIYLSQSKCLKSSPAGLKCMDCHDPHEPIRRNEPDYYNARCGSCHSSGHQPPAAACSADVGCSSCHMPGARPHTDLVFHNHWIGIYGAGEALLPVEAMAPSALRAAPASSSSGP